MDFARENLEKTGCGVYRSLPVSILPALYLAHNGNLAGDSGQVHAPVRELFEKNDKTVCDGMAELASITHAGVAALQAVHAGFNLGGAVAAAGLLPEGTVAICMGGEVIDCRHCRRDAQTHRFVDARLVP